MARSDVFLFKLGVLAVGTLVASGAMAASGSTVGALTGLAGVSALENNDAGKAVLASNLKVTADVQSGAARQPLLLSFADQQQQALRDAFITSGNAEELSDGLGGQLATAYQSLTSVASTNDGKTAAYGNVSPVVGSVIGFAHGTSSADATAGKYFFSDETTDGKTPVPQTEADILTRVHGVADIFGKAYNLQMGAPKADPFGDSRPFQTEPSTVEYTGKDYFGVDSSNTVYLRDRPRISRSARLIRAVIPHMASRKPWFWRSWSPSATSK
jgi:hypothetical protein